MCPHGENCRARPVGCLPHWQAAPTTRRRRRDAGATGAAAGSRLVRAPDVRSWSAACSKQIYLPFTLAQRLGYYDKAGVNVNIINEPAGGDATHNMLAGQVHGVGGFYDHNIVLQGRASPPSR